MASSIHSADDKLSSEHITTLHSYPFSATTGRELTTDAAVYAAAAADDDDDENDSGDQHARRSFLLRASERINATSRRGTEGRAFVVVSLVFGSAL